MDLAAGRLPMSDKRAKELAALRARLAALELEEETETETETETVTVTETDTEAKPRKLATVASEESVQSLRSEIRALRAEMKKTPKKTFL